MIKRRFYKLDHGDNDGPSDSSSSSDSEVDAEASVDTEVEEDDDNNVVVESSKKEQPCSSSSGYESEDSSGNEVNLDSSDSPTNDDGSEDEDHKRDANGTQLFAENPDMVKSQDTEADNDATEIDGLDVVLKSKSVFKCRLCPRIVCLTEETLKAHLTSKRHARSEKLLKEGRLKKMLNSDGEIEDRTDGETHQERHAAILALAESTKNSAQDLKKNKGRQRQKKRKALKKKTPVDATPKSTKKSPAKKRRKSDV